MISIRSIIASVTLLLLCGAASAQQRLPAFRHSAQHRIDSLKTLLSGTNLALHSNPANAILVRHNTLWDASVNNTTGDRAWRPMNTLVNCNYLCTPVIVLPVSGMELEGERINETSVRLKWKTFSETDNLGFDIERRFGSGGSFTTSSFVRGVGNSAVVTPYQTTDPNGYEGTTFYRLKQKDIDGSYNYSNTIAIKGIVSPPGIRVYPNPGTNASTIFQLTGFKDGEYLSITLTDALGRVLGHRAGYPGLNQFSIPLRSVATLPSGFYTIQVSSDSKKVSTTFVIAE